MFAGTDKDKMKKDSEFWAIMFLVIGVVSFVANVIQVNLGFICFSIMLLIRKVCGDASQRIFSPVCETFTL